MSNNSKMNLNAKQHEFRTVSDIDWPRFIGFLSNILINFMRALPEGLFAGAVILGLFTQNMAYLMLAVAMIIFKFAESGLGSFLKSTVTDVALRGSSVVGECSFSQTSLGALNSSADVIRSSAVPAGPLFFVIAVIFYSVSNIYKFNHELKTLNREDVLPVSGTFGILLMLVYVLWRMKSGCDSKEIILVSVLFAALIAFGVSSLFEIVFGRQSINLLNLPLLVEEKVTTTNIASCSPSLE